MRGIQLFSGQRSILGLTGVLSSFLTAGLMGGALSVSAQELDFGSEESTILVQVFCQEGEGELRLLKAAELADEMSQCQLSGGQIFHRRLSETKNYREVASVDSSDLAFIQDVSAGTI